MNAIAVAYRDHAPAPRAKALSVKLLGGGRAQASEQPRLPDLVYREGARDLVSMNPSQLQPLIEEARVKIAQYFGSAATVALTRFIDAEEPSAEPLLYLVIAADMSVADATSCLDRFYEEWWLDNVERGQDKVHVSLELW